MRITSLKRVIWVVILIFVLVAVFVAFWRGTPEKVPDVTGMIFHGLDVTAGGFPLL